MRQLSVVPDAVAVCADRLVAIVRVQSDGSVAIRDLANGQLLTTSAVELSAPPIASGLSADSATALHEAVIRFLKWPLGELLDDFVGEDIVAIELLVVPDACFIAQTLAQHRLQGRVELAYPAVLAARQRLVVDME